MGVSQKNNMATETYSISPTGEWVEETRCSCQRREDCGNMMINNGSLTSTSSSTSSSSTSSSTSTSSRRRSKSYSPMLITLIVWLSYLTCCVSAWPVLNHRRSFNYAPVPMIQQQQQPSSVVLPSDYDLDVNQWAMAAQPGGAVPDAYYDDLPNLPLTQDMYEDQLYEDPEEAAYQMPYFGPIIPEEPEEELELEELKHEQPYVYEKRRSGKVMNTKKPLVVATTPATTKATPKDKAATKVAASSPSLKKKVEVGAGAMNPGQKEIAMLRPPSPKSHRFQVVEPEEPKISVAQRSPSNEKPSAYDRLRKYLSLDDALKKEYEQRRASAVSRHTKRESISSIITDSDSLTGQLNGLKKKMD